MHRGKLDELWAALKTSALRHREAGRALSIEECEREVKRLVESVLGDDASVPSDAIAFYAAELCDRTSDAALST